MSQLNIFEWEKFQKYLIFLKHIYKSSFEKVSGGHFVHFFVPENLPSMPKHVIFVLDSSRSEVLNWKCLTISVIVQVDEGAEAEPAEGRHVLHPEGHEGGGHDQPDLLQQPSHVFQGSLCHQEKPRICHRFKCNFYAIFSTWKKSRFNVLCRMLGKLVYRKWKYFHLNRNSLFGNVFIFRKCHILILWILQRFIVDFR